MAKAKEITSPVKKLISRDGERSISIRQISTELNISVKKRCWSHFKEIS